MKREYPDWVEETSKTIWHYISEDAARLAKTKTKKEISEETGISRESLSRFTTNNRNQNLMLAKVLDTLEIMGLDYRDYLNVPNEGNMSCKADIEDKRKLRAYVARILPCLEDLIRKEPETGMRILLPLLDQNQKEQIRQQIALFLKQNGQTGSRS